MKLDIEQTIKVISSSNSKPVEESDSIQSVTTKEMDDAAANSIKAESTRELVEQTRRYRTGRLPHKYKL